MFNDPANIFVFGMIFGFIVLIIFVKINSNKVQQEEREEKNRTAPENKKKS